MKYLEDYKIFEKKVVYYLKLNDDEMSYARLCFIDLIEDSNLKFEDETDLYNRYYFTPIKKFLNREEQDKWLTTIDELILYSNTINEMILDINTALNRLKDEFSHAKSAIYLYHDDFKVCVTFYKTAMVDIPD